MSCQDERENRLNKAYPYDKQAQIQYINLAWMNEIGKKNLRINKSWEVLVNQWEQTLS